ncbi:PAS domain-containing sensor histidine kinase [Massilia sp. Dwa41.01b]|uniref:sensor histidine kinase n=1 Tax=Massilia sp. Dwa41.01b TaxID=2709302 RepID=UPI0023DE17D0|nr:ATP-binding protein [Massilia sp. Dwa41.01b]
MRLSLVTRFSALVGTLLAVGILIALGLDHLLPGRPLLVFGLCLACVVPIAIITVRSQVQPILSLFRALEGTVTSYRDGDFSFSLHWPQNDELSDLIEAHNALGTVLREQRRDLVQRELLLDTMVQNTPVAMLLVADAGGRGPTVVYANLAARQLLAEGRKLEGHALQDLLAGATPALGEALARGGDGLFTAGQGEDEQVYHLARSHFSLNGRRHELLLLRHLTAELRRQEVQTWKKVIRVISHELNNSLAPLASLAHSGAELVRRGQTERLPQIPGNDRRAHAPPGALHPRLCALRQAAHAAPGAARLGRLCRAPGGAGRFPRGRRTAAGTSTRRPGAAGTGSPQPAEKRARIGVGAAGSRTAGAPRPDVLRIDVVDRGAGMSEAVLTNALVPFYSTKRSGTGLGLALAREIAEAHGGRILLSNRDGGGLAVTLILPAP